MTGSVTASLTFTPTLPALSAEKGQNVPSTPFFLDSNTANTKDKHGNTTNGIRQICMYTYWKILESQEG